MQTWFEQHHSWPVVTYHNDRFGNKCVVLNNTIGYIRGTKIFQKPRNHFKIVGARAET
jgi:hypothetical protein